ncbi:maleylpyruvate isomerase family mycothiol-dependent enzyme [Qaidamihabitans albus]|uniref:maleylpyruvate isomerase family mycothiol-dependent enzyme n=1 Tax=Qaidamihabitans albus TaxID=2795733 RepID=UPI0018F14CA9|nr:maleylpyruvate isomerase family mycothiol-dependent enzyme [Qaidamihabitans albus]
MTGRHDITVTLAWMREGTAYLLRWADRLGDDAFAGPSRLPGWTRAHVLGHVARNAEALTRLATWARTGVETPMYTDRAQRNAEIEESAATPPASLRGELVSSAETLDAALEVLTAEQWQAQVRSALGRAVPAAEIPWMRIREVWLHAIDLDGGASVAELPDGVAGLLLDDVTAALSRKDGCPAVTLAPTDRAGTWRLGAAPSERTIKAPAADLVGWLTGRLRSQQWPALPAWL